jgi:HEAT repeat protein
MWPFKVTVEKVRKWHKQGKVEKIIEALQDQDSQVRVAAAGALRKFSGPEEISALCDALADEEWAVCREVSGALVDKGGSAVEPLIALLTDSNTQVREQASWCLARISDSRAVEPLIRALRDESWIVRRNTLEGLTDFASERLIEPISPLIDDDKRDVRTSAIETLRRIGSEQAIEPLSRALDDASPNNRKLAVETLRELKAIDELSRAVDDEDETVRNTALQYVCEFRKIDSLISALKWMKKDLKAANKAEKVLKKMGALAVEPLNRALNNSDETIRTAAARILGDIGDRRAVDPLIEALQDASPAVRDAAIESLSQFNAFEPLVRALGHSHDSTAHTAALHLQQGGSNAMEPVLAALDETEKQVRLAAVKILGEIGDARVTDRLGALLQEQDADIRMHAVASLCKLKAVGHLIAALDDQEPEVRARAAKKLGELEDERAVDSLTTILNDDNDAVRREAVTALGRIGDVRAIEPLSRILGNNDEDWDLQAMAVTSLGEIGGQEAVEPLIAALDHKYEEIRADAATGLKSLHDNTPLDEHHKELILNQVGRVVGKQHNDFDSCLHSDQYFDVKFIL